MKLKLSESSKERRDRMVHLVVQIEDLTSEIVACIEGGDSEVGELRAQFRLLIEELRQLAAVPDEYEWRAISGEYEIANLAPD